MLICSLCGHTDFNSIDVLWPELIMQWQLSASEAAYVNHQQGTHCVNCGANLRVIALADALREAWQSNLLLGDFVETEHAKRLRVLDINGSQALSKLLSRLPGYMRVDYPAVDIQALPYPDRFFDTVIHSDTLEHVAVPLKALEECRRVLTDGGRLCFTVPIIVGRMSRSRAGLPPSFHGDPATGSSDFQVQSEFGADVWTLVADAGFRRIMLNQVQYPSAIALSAW